MNRVSLYSSLYSYANDAVKDATEVQARMPAYDAVYTQVTLTVNRARRLVRDQVNQEPRRSE